MKKIILLLTTAFTILYAQKTAIIESRKYTVQHPYSYFEGHAKINEEEVAIGSFIVDMEGNIKADIPSYLVRNFGFSKNGIYVYYQTTNFVIVNCFGYVSYENMNAISKLGKTTKVDIEKEYSNTYYSNASCYETRYDNAFLSAEGGISDYCVYVHDKKVQSVQDGLLVKAIETKAEGKRMDQFYTPDGMYYAVFGGQNKLTLAQINLKTGEDKYVTLSKDYEDYFGGNMQIVGDKIYLATFYGTCDSKTDLMNYWAATKTDGLLAMAINSSDLKIENKTNTDIPSDYSKLITNNKGQSYVSVSDILVTQNEIYVLTYAGDGPYAIWKYDDDGIELVSKISTSIEKATVESAKLFQYDGKKYILYVVSAPANLGHYSLSLHLCEFDGADMKEIELAIEASDEVKGSFDLKYSFISEKGLIMIPGNNNYDTNHLIKIQL